MRSVRSLTRYSVECFGRRRSSKMVSRLASVMVSQSARLMAVSAQMMGIIVGWMSDLKER